jgi:hypothetical protein
MRVILYLVGCLALLCTAAQAFVLMGAHDGLAQRLALYDLALYGGVWLGCWFACDVLSELIKIRVALTERDDDVRQGWLARVWTRRSGRDEVPEAAAPEPDKSAPGWKVGRGRE